MDIQPIHSEDDLTRTLERVETLWTAEPGSSEEDELNILTDMVVRYEFAHDPIPASTPAEVIRFMMEQNDRGQSDLAELIGSKARASELLSGKRDPSLQQIRLLHFKWGIPAAALIGKLMEA
jgi:HTH-type transcriptional regulator/antitoxin HigA